MQMSDGMTIYYSRTGKGEAEVCVVSKQTVRVVLCTSMILFI